MDHSSPIRVRWVDEIDAPTARDLVVLVDSTVADGGTLGYARPMSEEEAAAFIAGLRAALAKGDSHVLLGHAGERAAFLAVLTRSGMRNCRHRAELTKGVVHPDFRGRHLVPLAFRELVARAEALGVEQFVLDVREGTRAHRLWQHLGFQTYGVLDDYARVGDIRHRGHFMSQSVAALAARLRQDTTSPPCTRNRSMPDTKAAFKEELRRLLHGHLTLAHPIFTELLDSRRPNLPLLRAVTLQGYQLTRHFLDYVEHLFFHCPLPKFKRALLINVYEEETGRLSGTDNHVVLMQRFIRALGVTDDERDAVRALPATQALIDYRLAAVRDPGRYHVGAAAVMIASEGQNLETRAGEARHELLGQVYGLKPADLEFFSVHQAEDVGHVEQGLNLVSSLCDTPVLRREALEAVDHTCRLFYAMYDGMYQAFCQPVAQQAAAMDGALLS